MKIIITEAQYSMLSNSIRRRFTPDDFEFINNEIPYIINTTRWTPDFNDFSRNVMQDLMHEFVLGRKGDEVEIEDNPDYGSMYDEDSLSSVFEMYLELVPFLKEEYKDSLYQAWKVKGRSR